MSTIFASKDYQIYAETIVSLTAEVSNCIEGIKVLSHGSNKKRAVYRDIQVYFISDNKVSIDLFTSVVYGYSIPEVVSQLQECIKNKVEQATRFKVSNINVNVVNIIFED